MMSAIPTPASEPRTSKGKKASANPPSMVNPGHSGPTTFFLKSERDIEKSAQRGRKSSRTSASTSAGEFTPSASEMGDSRFGVQSLEDTISSAFSSDTSLSRTSSNVTEPNADVETDANVVTSRKRKVGNPVHPRIVATGQRIISAEQPPTQASSGASPSSFRSSESPFRTNLRRGSASSSINLGSQPLTPLKMSPQPESAMPSTPRSGSPKSFRLSDEESSGADETGSQAIHSSSGEEDEDVLLDESKRGGMPQLVMPSIAIPTRRPFTERGRRMGRLKVMVVGANGIGKTSLIQSILRSCEDVVHVDPASNATLHQPTTVGLDGNTIFPMVEVHASTRPYPSWWTDFENRRMLLRRKSVGDGVLERNLCFIDTPGIDNERESRQVLRYGENLMRRTANMERMGDSELIGLLSGDGGVQLDAVLWLVDADRPPDLTKTSPQNHLLRTLSSHTNVIPLIGRGDLVDRERVQECKHAALDLFTHVGAEPYLFDKAEAAEEEVSREPFLVSSAVGDDTETMDASVLMSSQYVPPLVPSELDDFIARFFDPDNIARMRHLSATKFLLWRQAHLGQHIDLQKQMSLKCPPFAHPLPSATSDGRSTQDEPTSSKPLLPHDYSSLSFRSTSPSTSESSAPSATNAIATSAYALSHHNEQTTTAGAAAAITEPFRQIRLAKWASDLQRSLHNERKRYQQLYPSPLPSDDSTTEKHDALVTTTAPADDARPPPRGRLGGPVAVFEPRDPLGVLAFTQAVRRRGWVAVRVAGGWGLLFGVVAVWVWRVEVQEWWYGNGNGSTLGFGRGGVVVPQISAVPPPPSSSSSSWGRSAGLVEWVEGMVDWRGFFGWR